MSKGFLISVQLLVGRIRCFLIYLRAEFNAMELLIIIGIGLIVLYILFRIFKAFLKWTIIIVLGLLALAYFTNPGEPTHRQSLRDLIQDLSIKKIREKSVSIDDYKIFSVTKVKVRGEKKIVGVGAFGKVWYFKDIEDRLKKK